MDRGPAATPRARGREEWPGGGARSRARGDGVLSSEEQVPPVGPAAVSSVPADRGAHRYRGDQTHPLGAESKWWKFMVGTE